MTHQFECHARLPDGGGKMRPQDWKSGEQLCVSAQMSWARAEVIAPFGGAVSSEMSLADVMVADVKAKVLPGWGVAGVLAVEAGKLGVRMV
jgi:hypothetical protein